MNTSNNTIRNLLPAVILCLAGAFHAANAADYTWNGGSNVWALAANWTGTAGNYPGYGGSTTDNFLGATSTSVSSVRSNTMTLGNATYGGTLLWTIAINTGTILTVSDTLTRNAVAGTTTAWQFRRNSGSTSSGLVVGDVVVTGRAVSSEKR